MDDIEQTLNSLYVAPIDPDEEHVRLTANSKLMKSSQFMLITIDDHGSMDFSANLHGLTTAGFARMAHAMNHTMTDLLAGPMGGRDAHDIS